MNESHLRQAVCQAAHQLWARGLISGDRGMVTAALHRRRYLVTPPGIRRAALGPESVPCVDLGGLDIGGGPGLPEAAWRPHRAACKGARSAAADAAPEGAVGATLLVEPPVVMALLRCAGEEKAVRLGERTVPICDLEGEEALGAAACSGGAAGIRGVGLLIAAADLPTALNLAERIDHLARIELALGAAGQPDHEHEEDPPQVPPESPPEALA